ncbi:hypothetical protein D3C72_2430290 [compost metagenome]
MLEEMDRACRNFDYEGVRRSLQSIIKEYTPQCGIEDFIWLEQARLHLPKIGETPGAAALL